MKNCRVGGRVLIIVGLLALLSSGQAFAGREEKRIELVLSKVEWSLVHGRPGELLSLLSPSYQAPNRPDGDQAVKELLDRWMAPTMHMALFDSVGIKVNGESATVECRLVQVMESPRRGRIRIVSPISIKLKREDGFWNIVQADRLMGALRAGASLLPSVPVSFSQRWDLQDAID